MASESSKRQQWQRTKDVQCMANLTVEAMHLKVDCGSDLMSYMLMTAWQSVSQIPHLAYFHIPQKWDRNSRSNSAYLNFLWMRCGDACSNGVQWSSIGSKLPALALPSKPKASVQPQKLKKCPVASKQEFVDINVHSARRSQLPKDLAAKCINRWDQTAGDLTWWFPMIYTAQTAQAIRIRAKSEFRASGAKCDPLVQNVAPSELALAMLASSRTICIRISLVLEPRPRFVESV